ncbi:MAG: GTP cyclohydrolase II [Chloroflexota bacterium]|nr:MAG: GTP cyclohydrolase II [Chloroflexota bacterium]
MEDYCIERRVESRIPTASGEFRLYLYTNNRDEKEHLAMVMGEVSGKRDILVRVHSECYTGDVLGSLRCDCGEQLQSAMQSIALAGEGVLIYLRQEGRGIGLLDKLRAYNLQDQGLDTVDANLALGHQADERDYTIAAYILNDLGVKSVQLLTNNPLKIEDLLQKGIPISQRVPLEATVTTDNADYLFTKAQRMHHMLNLEGIPENSLTGKNGGRNGSA